jgi:hypothetical protein
MAEAIAVRGALVRGDACWKCPTLKREKKTGKEIDRKIKWDKRYVVLTDTKPSAVYWYKSDAVRPQHALTHHVHLVPCSSTLLGWLWH